MTLIDLANSPHLADGHRAAIAARLRAQDVDQLGRRTDRVGRQQIRAGIPASHPRGDGEDDDSDDDSDSDDDADSDDDDQSARRPAKKPAARRRSTSTSSDDDDDSDSDDDAETDAQKAARLERELNQERRRRERLERRSKAKRPARQRNQQDEEQEQELATARGRGDRLATRLVTQERDAVITRIASRLRFEDPSDAVDYLTRPGRLPDNVAELVEEDGADVEVDVDESAIEAALKKLAKSKPKWLKEAGTQQSREAGRGDRARRRNSNGDGSAESDFDPRGRLARAYAGTGG